MFTLAFAAAVSVEFVQNGFAAEWFAVRTGTAPSAYARAMDAAKEVADDRETIVAMNSVDGLAAQSETPTALLTLLGRLPERLEFQGAKSAAQKIAEEIAKVPTESRDSFRAMAAPRTTHAVNLLKKELAADPRLLQRIAEDLHIELGDTVVRVLVVPAAPRPGAATYRTPQGPLCVVGLLGFAEHELLEAVAHEAAHAMDDLSRAQDSLLNRLRKALADANVPSTDPRTRDVPHAVVFAAVAHRVKEAKGPRYVPYGDAHGAYARLGQAARVVNEVWPHRGTLEETVAEIVRRIMGESGAR
jgi:hypothetical protein